MQSPWRLETQHARLESGALSAELDLDRPEVGLSRVSFAGLSLNGRALGNLYPLGVQLGAGERPPLVEGYVRGDDLIATFGESAGRPFRWQVYWRVRRGFAQALAALELVVSVQTHLLDSEPSVRVSSVVPASSCGHWRSTTNGSAYNEIQCPPSQPKRFSAAEGPGCFSFSLAGTDVRYLEMVHPADFESSVVEPSDAGAVPSGVRVAHRLFAHRLEKGVILRARVLSLLLPSSASRDLAAEHYRSFVDEELPLTT